MAGPTDPMSLARKRVQEALLARAEQDPAFRSVLVTDPRAALKQLLGVDPIPGYRIRVIEEQPGEAILVLPRDIATDELPDELLDLASGGFIFSGDFYPEEWGCKRPKS